MPEQSRLVVPITRAESPVAEQVRAARAAGADVVELRVDCIADVAAVGDLLARPRAVPLILTIRAREEGGSWGGDDAERATLLERLGRLGPGYVDVEYATWARSALVREKVGGVCGLGRSSGEGGSAGSCFCAENKLILSHHDLSGTPADLDAVITPLLKSPAAVVKVVFSARDATDAWRVVALLRRYSVGRRIVALAMGEAGLLTRVLIRKFGGFLTFAALQRGAESAPGQSTVKELLDLYRWRDIGTRTGVFGVVGWPVSQSRSPLLHNVAMADTGIDGVFLPMPVAPGYSDFGSFMDYLTDHAELDVRGLGVTIPHKQHALRWLDERDLPSSDLACRAGAVNTLTRIGPASWVGDNTDVAGVLAALRSVAGEGLDSIRDCEAAVLGAGGVARAAVIGLQDQDLRVTVFNRTEERARALARDLHCAWKPWEKRVDADYQVLINCTSVGMHPEVDASPLPPEALRPGMMVLDTVYTPARTRLLRDARRRGCHVVGGEVMFIGQAAGQFELWHGRAAPVEVMHTALSHKAGSLP